MTSRPALAALVAGASGCSCPEPSIWSNYLWIEVLEMPRDVVAASVIVDGRSAPLSCAVSFDTEGGGSGVEGDSGDFGEIVIEYCDAADSTGTYGQGWWTMFPHRGFGETVRLTLDWETESGERGGFDEQVVRPEWTWDISNGPLCRASVRGIVYIDPYGGEPVRY